VIVPKDGQRELVEYADVDTNSSVIKEIGRAFEQERIVRKVKIDRASCRLFSIREAVDFTADWLVIPPANDLFRSESDDLHAVIRLKCELD